jgi:hypothetical protein
VTLQPPKPPDEPFTPAVSLFEPIFDQYRCVCPHSDVMHIGIRSVLFFGTSLSRLSHWIEIQNKERDITNNLPGLLGSTPFLMSDLPLWSWR